ncbi:hypothetical protein ScPMuIL_002779 [Solemya velum]
MSRVQSENLEVQDKMSTCSSCGVSLDFYNEKHVCNKCGSMFCSSCNALKEKLSYMSGKPARRSSKECTTCQLLKKANNSPGGLKNILSYDQNKEPRVPHNPKLEKTSINVAVRGQGQIKNDIIQDLQKTVHEITLTDHLGEQVKTSPEDNTEFKCVRDQEEASNNKHYSHRDDDKTNLPNYNERYSGKSKTYPADPSLHEIDGTKDDNMKSEPHKNNPEERAPFENDFQNRRGKDEIDLKPETTEGVPVSGNSHRQNVNNIPNAEKISECIKLHLEKGPPLQSIGKAVPSSGCNVISDLPSKKDNSATPFTLQKEDDTSCVVSIRETSGAENTTNTAEEFNKNKQGYIANPYKSGLSEVEHDTAWDNILSSVSSTSADVRDLESCHQSADWATVETGTTQREASSSPSVKGTTRKSDEYDGPITPGPRVIELPGEEEMDQFKLGSGEPTSQKKTPRKLCLECGRPECTGNKFTNLLQQMMRVASASGLEVRDVTSDGNCMFTAVIDQLTYQGDTSYSIHALRQAAVDYLRANPHSEDGTPYSEFLDTETWDNYLNRMSQDGQWGDHMIMRAIAEITSRTIQVISAEAGRDWTVIDPKSGEQNKKPAIYLGHVGEFHYVSLRVFGLDSRSSQTLGEDAYDIKPVMSKGEGPSEHSLTRIHKEEFYENEKAEMFKEDYIDDWTDLPVTHFSFVLKRIFPYKTLESTDYWSMKLMQMIENIKVPMGTRKEVVGSIAESFYLPGLTCMHTTPSQGSPSKSVGVTCLCIQEALRVFPKGHDSMSASDTFFETDSVHPGYLHIVARYPGFGDTKAVIPNTAYKSQPSMTEKVKSYSDYHPIDFQIECKCAFSCPVWPSVADEWPNRRRPVNWPKKHIIQSIVSEGCHIVPIAHKNSSNETIEWQFLFSVAERTISLEALSKHQKYCYIFFKAFFTQYLEQCRYITSGHLKSIFFYACELVPESLWSANPGACILYLMDQLFVQVQERNIPNYFIPANNMIDHFTEEMSKELQPLLMTFRTQPLSAVQQLALNSRITCAPTVIEKVLDDVPLFRSHRSIRESTFTVFLPQTISQIQTLVYGWKISDALELASEAYEERLAVSTCRNLATQFRTPFSSRRC